MKKVKLYSIKKNNNYYAQWISGTDTKIHLAWSGKSNKDGEFPILGSFTSCREVFICALWRCICEPIPRPDYASTILYNRNTLTEELLPDTRVRVVVRHISKTNEATKEFPVRAKRVLNIFERYLGWRLTRISLAEGECSAKITAEYSNTIKASDYLFEFSKKWARSPELLSLYLMIVKLCQYNIWDNFGDVKDLPKVVHAVCGTSRKGDEIVKFFTGTYKYWIPVLDRIDELFMKQNTHDNFEHYDGSYGFHVFVLNQVVRSPAQKKWKKIRKELGGKAT